jgi:V/A-type H+-transporting ATPase subunit D
MLQLKKQQLQAEIQAIDYKLEETTAAEQQKQTELNKWVKLFADSAEIEKLIVLKDIVTEEGNIAGVSIPVLTDVKIKKEEYDLFLTPSWYDDAVEMLDKIIRLRIEGQILHEQRRLVTEELRTTSQRVNLIEKVKIPECRENIRVIKIFLGDEQTAGVVRSKIAKSRTQEYQYEDEAA